MAHWESSVKAAGARSCIELRDESIATGYTEAMHHPLSARFLAESSRSLRQLVESLATTGVAYPVLAMDVARLKFIPVVERAPRVIEIFKVAFGNFQDGKLCAFQLDRGSFCFLGCDLVDSKLKLVKKKIAGFLRLCLHEHN